MRVVWRSIAAALLLPACNLFVSPAPAVVRPDTPLSCTDTYLLPAADATASAVLLGYAGWVAYKIDDGCDRGDPDWCDPQGGIAVAIPLLAGLGLALAAEVGRRRVHRCRDARTWQRETPQPPLAGQVGAACVPVFGREGRCEGDSPCIDGRCQQPSLLARLRRACASPVARWRAERNPARRARQHAALPPACRHFAR